MSTEKNKDKADPRLKFKQPKWKKQGSKQGKDPETKPHGIRGFGDNDISWYTVSEQLLKDVGRLPFGRPIGTKMPVPALYPKLNLDKTFGFNKGNQQSIIPGICVINYTNAIGASADGASPVNIASRAMYSFVRHANSGHTNYESPDLMMYLLAAGEIYTAIAFLQKIYGCAMYWSQRNRYFGDTLIHNLGFNPSNVRKNLAQLRTGINVLAMKANALAVPKSLPIYERRFFLASHVYKDEDNEKAQLYTFRPQNLYWFSGTKANTGSILIPVNTPWQYSTSSCSVDDAIAYVSELLDQLIADEDIGIMAGDILKAFGDGNMHKLLSIPDEYIIQPIYNAEMLQQIHNLYVGVYDGSYTKAQFDNFSISITSITDITRARAGGLIGQFNGVIYSARTIRDYTFTTKMIDWNDDDDELSSTSDDSIPTPKLIDLVIDTDRDDPTAGDVMIATRLAFNINTNVTYTFADAYHQELYSFGTEVIHTLDVVEGVYDPNQLPHTVTLRSKCLVNFKYNYYGYKDASNEDHTVYHFMSDEGSATADFEAGMMLLNFKKAPLLVVDTIQVTADDFDQPYVDNSFGFFQDVSVMYTATIDSATLISLNEVALLSLFRIPELGMWRI